MAQWHVEAEATAKASPETVWALVSDATRYPSWGPWSSGHLLSGDDDRPGSRRGTGRRSQSVDGGGGAREHGFALGAAQSGGQVMRSREDVGVAGGQGAHRPVGAEHHPGRAERVERDLGVGTQGCD